MTTRRRPTRPSRLRCERFEDRTVPTVITVTSTSDLLLPDGQVTLREALIAASTNLPLFDAPAGSAAPVPDIIRFAIPGAGVHTIKPLAELPHVTGPTFIEGYSQPG